jgi:hypothetical protein
VVAGAAAAMPLPDEAATAQAGSGDAAVSGCRPWATATSGRTSSPAYPCYPREIRLGVAAAKEVYCNTDPNLSFTSYGFDVWAHFFHSFYKPFNVTLDFTNMNLYIARGQSPADRRNNPCKRYPSERGNDE